jgi:hypothetical protein
MMMWAIIFLEFYLLNHRTLLACDGDRKLGIERAVDIMSFAEMGVGATISS